MDEAKAHFKNPPKFDPNNFHPKKCEGRNETSFNGLVIPQNAGGIVTSTNSDEL